MKSSPLLLRDVRRAISAKTPFGSKGRERNTHALNSPGHDSGADPRRTNEGIVRFLRAALSPTTRPTVFRFTMVLSGRNDTALLEIVYASSVAPPFGRDRLGSLVSTARLANARANITGILLYDKAVFLHVLEGPPEAVEALYARIERDRRHHSVTRLGERLVPQRSFEKWPMGFATLEDVPRDESFSSSFARDFSLRRFVNGHHADRARAVLASFRCSRWLRFVHT